MSAAAHALAHRTLVHRALAHRTGAEACLDALVAAGTDTVFGYPGGAVLPLYDALHGRTDLRHVLVRHEQAAVHMAEGYARATGRPGVVLVTSGPGLTNAVTGLVDALMDSVPVLVIAGQVARDRVGTDAFQEANAMALTRPATKWSRSVARPEDIAPAVAEALARATTGRPARCCSNCRRTRRRRPPSPRRRPAGRRHAPGRITGRTTRRRRGASWGCCARRADR